MAKPKVKKVKFTPEEMAYDLPDELDFSKLRYVGRGIAAVDQHIARSKLARTEQLAPDVAKAFRTEAEVNEALRLVQKMREIGKPVRRRQPA